MQIYFVYSNVSDKARLRGSFRKNQFFVFHEKQEYFFPKVEYVCDFNPFTPSDGKKRKRIATPPRSKTILGSFCPPTAKSASA